MEEYSQENLEYFERILGQITIYIDEQTSELCFACDWKDQETGVASVAEILYQLKYDNLSDKILLALKEQCVNDNRLDDFNLIQAYISKKRQNMKTSSDLVVSPREIK
jgi:hypothetical protein